MSKEYKHGRTSVYKLNYHIVWCVKYRRKVLTEDVAARLCDILKQIGEEKGFDVVEAKVGENDHVHCFVSAPPKHSVTDIAKWLKGISGRWILMEFPGIKDKLWRGDLWNGSYFAESIGTVNEDVVRKYIERQKSVQL